MGKIRINMLSKADSVEGQGVGSAYLEQVSLVKEGASEYFDVSINKKHGEFDIYHHHSVNPGFYFKMRRKKKSVHVVYVHFLPETLDGSIKLPKISFNIFRNYIVSYYRRADQIVVVNPIFTEPLVNLGIKKENITYIPNFVDKKDFHVNSMELVNKTKDDYQLDRNKFTVLGVGQIQNRKGVLDFIEVANDNPNMQFIWAGGFSFGKITDGYKELKKIYDCPPSNVKFLGIVPREKMNDIYNACDCLFMPSYNELFPMSILEAANAEKPVVLRDLDLYEPVLFRKYVAANTNEEFSESLRKLRDNKEFYKAGVENSKFISEFYSKENVLKLWIEYYQRVYKTKFNR